MTRRDFLKILSQSGPLSALLMDRFFFHVASADVKEKLHLRLEKNSQEEGNHKTILFVYLRGGMDGLSMTPPAADPDYFLLRPHISVVEKNNRNLSLADGFVVHPALSRLHQIALRREAGFIFGAGSSAETRSHFDAQDWMEQGVSTNIIKNSGLNPSGFLARYARDTFAKSVEGQIIAVQNGFPKTLSGCSSALVFSDFKFLHGKSPLTKDKINSSLETKAQGDEVQMDPAFFSLFTESNDSLFQHAAKSLLKDLPIFQRAESDWKQYADKIPKGVLAKSLAQIASLIRTNFGLKIAVTEMGGWDTHVNQGNGSKGYLWERFFELDGAMGFFWDILGEKRENVTVVVVTEFGRTVKENGDYGTDHGHGSTFFILDTKIKKTIFHQYQGLTNHLYEGRDLPVHFDYRQIMLEVLQQQKMGSSIAADVLFPGFTSKHIGLFV
ncbi:MAG: DUF1501 domain-containing protein [Bdellovibrionales bacterium]|nr:DUF1501 domain-containing protein [Bdellovibrionales bacterium]